MGRTHANRLAAAADRIRSLWSFEGRYRVLHMTWFAFFLSFVVWFDYAPFAGTIEDELGLTSSQTLTLGLCNVALTVPARVFIGMALDRWGPRRVYAAILIGAAVPNTAFALSSSFEMLVVSRLALSVVGAGFVVGIRMVSEWFPPRELGTAEGVYGGWGNFGSAAAAFSLPVVAGVLGGPDGWRWAIGTVGVVSAAYGLVYLRRVQDTPEGVGYARPRRQGALEVTHPGAVWGLAALNVPLTAVLGLIAWRIWREDVISDAGFVAVLAAVAVLLVTRLRAVFAANRPALAGSYPPEDRYPFRTVAVLCLAYFATFGTELAVVTILPDFFADTWGLGPAAAGVAASGFAFTNLVARPGGGLLSDVLGSRRRTLVALSLGLVAGSLLLSTMGPAWPWLLAVAACMVCSFFAQAGSGAAFAIVPLVKKRVSGQIAGLAGAAGNVGAIVLLTVTLLTSTRVLFLVVAASAALAALAGRWIVEPEHSFAAHLLTDTSEKEKEIPMSRPLLLVAGNGMVGHRFVEAAVEQGLHETHEIVVLGEERHVAYDRMHLTKALEGADAATLRLGDDDFYQANGIDLRVGQRAAEVDPAARTVTAASGEAIVYDHLVLATGSAPFVPPVEGHDLAGVFVYRTLDDVEAIRAWATAGCRRGVVVGGGLLGLEAAGALKALGVEITVVELADRLMAVQVDDHGGRTLRRRIEDMGIDVRTGLMANKVTATHDGRAAGLEFDGDHAPVEAEIVIFAAGVRPRDELARAAGLEMGERGGARVDDTCLTSDPHVSAIGEVAAHRGGRPYGLVAPGYRMAEVLAARLAGDAEARFVGADMSTKLKLLGVDVASVGDAFGRTEGADELAYVDPVAGVYKKLVLSADHSRLLGGVLVGDAEAYNTLLQMVQNDLPCPPNPERLILPAGDGEGIGLKPTQLPDDATICSCHNVAKGAICGAVRDQELDGVGGIKSCTRAGTGCGSCVPVLTELLHHEMQAAGREVVVRLCEHFSQTRQELFEIVRITGIRTFAELVERFGTGQGCEICKPAVASMFASLSSGYILDGEQATLQDTNDHFLANLQRNGSYSIVPRVPGGEITPDQLIALGEVAKEFDLYSKITGAQRVDLFGARVDQLPAIWEKLIAVGFESGHAYGKALRTVKSCVGDSWCRYGVQDSVGMAIRIELRYRGLRSPHKLKMAVSGCQRECAEAQGKDVGVIATENGWNLYVGGNGGARPQHAVLLAGDLDDETLIAYIDRFLMYYIRTADRLERTAWWLNKLDGGIEHVKDVVIHDSLGICADLEADIARHVDTYECEWKATLEDPERLAKFRPFVNVVEPDESLQYIRVRGQKQPVELRPARIAAKQANHANGSNGANGADGSEKATAAAGTPVAITPGGGA